MIWLFILVFLWGVFHSLLASRKAKEVAQRTLGHRGMRFYRLIFNLLAGLSFIPILLALALLPDKRLYLIVLPWSVLLVLGEVLAVIALLVGFSQSRPMEFLGLSQLGSPQTESGQLNIGGLYRFVRHPLYTAGLAIIWLIPVMTMNIMAINISLTVYIIIGAYFEECKLKREFGQAYMDYMATTPMFIPFLKGNKPPHTSS
jgi:methanethiol S-methyltransferase